MEELNSNNVLRTYLITYSKIDHKIFPTRYSFGAAVVQAFGAKNVDYYAVSKEAHETGGYHYHVAIKLNHGMRWHSARDYLKDNFDVNVYFATTGMMYAGAFRYATKVDTLYFKGHVQKAHPKDLSMVSKTYEQAALANRTFVDNSSKRKKASEPTENKKKRRVID